jgi:DNA-binding response OmpR family regulator
MAHASHTVVIVEADEFLAGIYKKKFEMEGWKVRMVHNGNAVLQECVRHTPDAIVLDLVLPQKDGFTLLQDLKKERKTKSIPILIVTSLGSSDDVEKAHAMGAGAYMIKAHIRPSDIVEKITSLL